MLHNPMHSQRTWCNSGTSCCVLVETDRKRVRAHIYSPRKAISSSPLLHHRSWELHRFTGQRLIAQSNLQTNSPAHCTVTQVNIAALICLALPSHGLNVHFINVDELPGDERASGYCCTACLSPLFGMGTPVINSAGYLESPCGGGLQSRLLAWWLEAKSGRQIENCIESTEEKEDV